MPAKLTGKAIYASASSVDLPCVGDWVSVRYHDSGAHASILEVLPRKSFLRRRKPSAKAEFQMIAVNIDLAFIVQSCHFDFNVRRLERYLVITSEGGIEPALDRQERFVGVPGMSAVGKALAEVTGWDAKLA